MPIRFEQSETGGTIRLEGEVDAACSAELKRVLVEAISGGKELRVDFARVTGLDVTAVQLLCAATRQAAASAMSFGVVGDIPAGLSAALRDAGFEGFPVPRLSPVGETKSTLPAMETK